MATVDARLTSLRKFLESHASGETVFIVEGGGEFHTSEDPFSYLLEHGAYTPDGTRIVLFPHSIEGVDPLSLSLYQLIDEAVEKARLTLPALESDEIGGKALE